MLKSKKRKIQKAIKVLEGNEEDEKILITHINEVEQIFFECFTNENKKKRKIINTYVIPYVNLLVERVGSDNGGNNATFRENILTRILTFLSSILRINKNYSHLVISYFVNLIGHKHYIVKIVQHLKKIVIFLIKGLLFSRVRFHTEDKVNDCRNNGNRDDEMNNLRNVKEGFHHFVILKSKLFNILVNYQFDKSINENPYKYELIKNLMLILTKEILFYFHILKNRRNIFKEILCEEKKVHQVINDMFDLSYLNDVTKKVNLNNVDEIILIWLEQNISLFNELVLFSISKSANGIYNTYAKGEVVNTYHDNENISSSHNSSIYAHSVRKNDLTNVNGKTEEGIDAKKKGCTVKQDNIRKGGKENSEEEPNFEIVNKLICYFNEKRDCPDTMGTPFLKEELGNTHAGEKENRNVATDTTATKGVNHEYLDHYISYHNYYGIPVTCTTGEERKSVEEGKARKKYLISSDCLVEEINQMTTDNIVFLTHLMRNIFYLIREVPFILNFFLKNLFVMIERLMRLKEKIITGGKTLQYDSRVCNISEGKLPNNCRDDDVSHEDDLYGDEKRGKGAIVHSKVGLNHVKRKLLCSFFHYMTNELYMLICRNNVHFPFYYTYITSLLHIIGEVGSTEELAKKKSKLMNCININKGIEKKRKINETNLSYAYLKKNVLRKMDCGGYKKLKNEEVDIMAYLKVKMDDSESENKDGKKLEKENLFINQIVKKLYHTNFKLDREYYERFNCSRKTDLVDIIRKQKLGASPSVFTDSIEMHHNREDCMNHSELLYQGDWHFDVHGRKGEENDEGIAGTSNNTGTSIRVKTSSLGIGASLGMEECSESVQSLCKHVNQNKKDDVDYEGSTQEQNVSKMKGKKSDEKPLNKVTTQNDFIKKKYKEMYSTFFSKNFKYYDHVKNNETILGSIDFYFFLLFSQILNNNLENNVQVLGENFFMKRINNLKIVNNIVKRILINSMMKEKLKFYFLTLYIVKINSACIFKGGTSSDHFLNYSTVFKIFNNLLFYAYVQERMKKESFSEKREKYTKRGKHRAVKENKHGDKSSKYYHKRGTHRILHPVDDTLGYTEPCYNYFRKLKKKMKKDGNVYRHELQKGNFKLKCKYDEIFNVIIYFLHNDKLLTNNRDQYIKTFIEQILETPKLPFSFFIYLILWLNNIHVHIDYKGYINHSSRDNLLLVNGERVQREGVNEPRNEGKDVHDSLIHAGQMDTSNMSKAFQMLDGQDETNRGGQEEVSAMEEGEHRANGTVVKSGDFPPYRDITCDGKYVLKKESKKSYLGCDNSFNCYAPSDTTSSHFDVELSESDADDWSYVEKEAQVNASEVDEEEGREKYHREKENIPIFSESAKSEDNSLYMTNVNIGLMGVDTKHEEEKAYPQDVSSVSENEDEKCNFFHNTEGDHNILGSYNNGEGENRKEKDKENDHPSSVSCREIKLEEKLFNINYYIKYSNKLQNSSNYYIFSFSLISNLLKKNQNIKAKKTILAIYINTLFKSSNEIRNLLKKLITASKGIYNNTLNFFVYTKRVYTFYHKVFILFLLYICNMYIPNLKNDILFFSHFAFYLWPIELINFIHNFLVTNFSFFYNDILPIFVNYEKITFYEKRMVSLRNYALINDKLNECISQLDRLDIFQSVEVFLKETDFFNNSNMSDEAHGGVRTTAGERCKGDKSEGEEVEGNDELEGEEEMECILKNEISQKILLEEIFVRMFLKTVDLVEERQLLEKMKKSNIFLNIVSIEYVDRLCKFVFTNIEKAYEKNKDDFWLNFYSILNEAPDDDKTKAKDQVKYLELQEILNFLLNTIDNFLSICVRSTMFFHLYLFTYSNCAKIEIRTILLKKFIATLPLLKSLYHEEFFRILKYNNKVNNKAVEEEETVEKHEEGNKQSESADDPKTEKTGSPNGGIEKSKEATDKGAVEKDTANKKTNDTVAAVNGTAESYESSAFQVNIEILKYIRKCLYECPSHPTGESHANFLNFCYNLYLENNNIHFIIELIGFLKKEQTLYIFNEIIKGEMEENAKIEILKCCINSIIKLPYSYILEKQNESENESYYITNIEIFYFYYNLNRNKNIQKVMLDYFVTKVNFNSVDDQENNKLFNDITIKDVANIIQQIAENSNSIFPIYGRFLCQFENAERTRDKHMRQRRTRKKCANKYFIDECTMLFNGLKQKYSITSDLIELISSNEQVNLRYKNC
ncbi:conserved Plasmodium protein, unknown function [Plasmodium ovale curtisi]|uniref:Symplekin C-terminal domain-containing protein n=1 Tax=Plasmodium ovale curtisi TaxID=864141 RepID=A0A1A8X296_PLAOA|nr:conserved Plasmodium protein, unknown function [Plasmodium ovale curtisi]